MTETKYPAGQRPRIRLQGVTGVREPVLVRINSRSAYFRSRYVVGEMACNADEVEIIRHADGTPVLETEHWPPLTPYDTGQRLQPEVWVTPDRRRPEEHDPDRYGRVDFNNDENATDVTVWVERGESGGTVINIDGHSEIERVVVNAMDNTVDPVIDLGSDVPQVGALTAERLVELLRKHGEGGDWIDTDASHSDVVIDGRFDLSAIVAAINGED